MTMKTRRGAGRKAAMLRTAAEWEKLAIGGGGGILLLILGLIFREGPELGDREPGCEQRSAG